MPHLNPPEVFGIVPGTGHFLENWPSHANLPQGLSGAITMAGWTEGNEGFVQQTFLGASIRSFSAQGGFGDSSSTLNIEVVNDEYNKSDGLDLGATLSDDVYHNGKHDEFKPPIVGSPVFFKFGKNFANVPQAYGRTFDELYDENTVNPPSFPTKVTTGPITSTPGPNYYLRSTVGEGAQRVNTWVNKTKLTISDNEDRGYNHFVFGGILQSYTENRSSSIGPTYSVQVTDPREILSNAVVLLNNYQGTTFNNKNLFNVYGFLEYDPSDELLEDFEGTPGNSNTSLLDKSVLKKTVDDEGCISYEGWDLYKFSDPDTSFNNFNEDSYPAEFPITGQGFSRRSDQGIPWYRVHQAITALFSYHGSLPEEYKEAGFGGKINFRGYNYVVDFTGIPFETLEKKLKNNTSAAPRKTGYGQYDDKIVDENGNERPDLYFLNFDQLNMLELAQELCDIISHDMYVTLLPVIDHPACKWLYRNNLHLLEKPLKADPDYPGQDNGREDIVAGIIRIDAIDRSEQPKYGKIKNHLDDLQANGINVTNRNIGFEVTNVTTDKFIVGAQEVNL